MGICTSVFTIFTSQKEEKAQFSINKQMDEHHMVCAYFFKEGVRRGEKNSGILFNRGETGGKKVSLVK